MKSHFETSIRVKLLSITLVACMTTAWCAPAMANTEHDIDTFLSGSGNDAFLVAGALLPLLEDGAKGKNHALRTVDALGSSVLVSEGLKYIVREKRPDGSDRESFPSGHATAAFAVAAEEAHFHPRQAPFWYLGAAAIGFSRVDLHKHYLHDVVAGALLGYGMARWELSRRRGLILFPVIQPDQNEFHMSLRSTF